MNERGFYVIGELGTNWIDVNQIVYAARLIARAGADALKLQVGLDKLYSAERDPDSYQKMQAYKLSNLDIARIARACQGENIDLWASVFDIEQLEQCAKYLSGIKIASTDIVYDDMLRVAARLSNKIGIPLMLSTGAATVEEVHHAIEMTGHSRRLILMQCKAEYPTKPEDANICWPLSLQYAVDAIGYSDHTKGDNLPAQLAIAAGYTYFEKHVKIANNPDNPDNDISTTVSSFSRYIDSLQTAKNICGTHKDISSLEMKVRKYGRRGEDGRRPGQ